MAFIGLVVELDMWRQCNLCFRFNTIIGNALVRFQVHLHNPLQTPKLRAMRWPRVGPSGQGNHGQYMPEVSIQGSERHA